MLTHTDLSIIAMIGIILLIGIVKKNAIMMIDFALAAERNEGKNSRDAIYEACLLRFRPILMTTMAAHAGRSAAGARHRHRIGAAPAAGHHHHRRPDRQPVADAVHDAGGVSLFRPAAALVVSSAPQRAARKRTRWDPKSDAKLSPRSLSPACCCYRARAWSARTISARPRPLTPAYKEPPPEGWKEAQPNDGAISGKWWEIYNDPQLNALEEQVNISNQNVLVGRSEFPGSPLRRGHCAGGFIAYGFGRAVGRGFAVFVAVPAYRLHRRITGLYQLPASASWTADIWGSIRRSVRASEDTAQADYAQLENARLSYQSELAADYFGTAWKRWRNRSAGSHALSRTRNISS